MLSEWIKCEDRLPDDIVRVTDGETECYGWVLDGKRWVLDDGHDWTPTHWQELSALPDKHKPQGKNK